MKSLLIAFGLCVAGSILCYLLLTSLGINKDVAKIAATIVLGAFPKLRETIEKMQVDQDSEEDELRRYEDFNTSPPRSIAYVVVVGFVILEASSGVATIVTLSLGAQIKDILIAVGLLFFFIAFPALYLCGRWIGRKCRKYPVTVSLFCAPIIRIVATVFDKLVTPEEAYKEILADTGALQQIFSGTILIAAPLAVGAIIGKRQRLVTYFTYLLGKLEPSSRAALLELAYEDATRLQKIRKEPSR